MIVSQRVQAHSTPPGLARRKDQDSIDRHYLPFEVQPRGNPLHHRLRYPSDEDPEQARDQPEDDQGSSHQGVRDGDRTAQGRSARTSCSLPVVSFRLSFSFANEPIPFRCSCFGQQASREKNGVFLSQESWADLASENELRKTQTEEAKSRQIILETRLAGLKTELEDHLKIFLATESELKLTKEEVVAKVEELVRKEQELEGVKEELEVEKVVSEVFEKGEKRLDGVAGGLRRLAKESLGDLEGVFSKLGELVVGFFFDALGGTAC